MSELEPITREELLLNSIAGEGDSGLSPITRQEHYLSAIAGESDLPEGMEPITREEIYYQKILDNGGAGGGGDEPTGTKTININANGTTSHNVKAYATAQIITNVPNPSAGTKNITANGDHDVTDYATAHVAVPQPSGSVNITQNGTHNVADYAEAVVNVPNSYGASDEGKVVSNGALVAQTSKNVTANGTYDTTLNDEVVVNVPSSGTTPTGTVNINSNGTHDVTNYASANVNVPSLPNLGSEKSYTLSELFNALVSNGYSTGTFTVASYYPADTETMLFDTGFSGTVGGIVIFDLENPSVPTANNSLTLGVGIFLPNNSATADQTETSRGVWKTAASAGAKIFNSTVMTSRVNGGKMYITPKYATVANSHFMVGHTYRWIAWELTEARA